MLNVKEMLKNQAVRDNEIAVCGDVVGKVDDETARVIIALATGSLTVEALRNSVPVAPKAPATPAPKEPSKKSGKKPVDRSKFKDVVLEWGKVTKLPGEGAKGYYVTFGSMGKDSYAVVAHKLELAGGKYDKAVKGFAFTTKKAAEQFVADNKVVTAAERVAQWDAWDAAKKAKEEA